MQGESVAPWPHPLCSYAWKSPTAGLRPRVAHRQLEARAELPFTSAVAGSWKAYLEARHLQILASDLGDAAFARPELEEAPDLSRPGILTDREGDGPASGEARSRLLIPVLSDPSSDADDEDASTENGLALAA